MLHPPQTAADFRALLEASNLLDLEALNAARTILVEFMATESSARPAADAAERLRKAGLLTALQAKRILDGQPESLLLGDYRLDHAEEVVPGGAWFLGYHRQSRQAVRLHVVGPQLQLNGRTRDELLEEATRAARVQHPYLAPLEQATAWSKRLFVAYGMAPAPGVMASPELNLHELLNAVNALSVDESLPLWIQMAQALAALEAAGLTHGGLRLEALRVVRNGERLTLRVTQQGLSQLNGLYSKLNMAYRARYLAPEYDPVNPTLAAGTRADLYAFGVLAYRMVIGFFPFEGNDPAAILRAHRQDPVPAPQRVRPGLPGYVAPLLLSLLAKNPTERPASFQALLTWLQECQPVADTPSHTISMQNLWRRPTDLAVATSQDPPSEDIRLVLAQTSQFLPRPTDEPTPPSERSPTTPPGEMAKPPLGQGLIVPSASPTTTTSRRVPWWRRLRSWFRSTESATESD